MGTEEMQLEAGGVVSCVGADGRRGLDEVDVTDVVDRPWWGVGGWCPRVGKHWCLCRRNAILSEWSCPGESL